jgi:hypothetical protein
MRDELNIGIFNELCKEHGYQEKIFSVDFCFKGKEFTINLMLDNQGNIVDDVLRVEFVPLETLISDVTEYGSIGEPDNDEYFLHKGEQLEEISSEELFHKLYKLLTEGELIFEGTHTMVMLGNGEYLYMLTEYIFALIHKDIQVLK